MLKKLLLSIWFFWFINFTFAVDNFIGRTDFGFVENSNVTNSILLDVDFGVNVPFVVQIRNKFNDDLNLKFGAVDWMFTADSMSKKACKENGDSSQFSGYVSFENTSYFALSGYDTIVTSWSFNFPATMSGIRHWCVLYYPYYSWNSNEVQALSRKAIIVNLKNSDLRVTQTVTWDFYSWWIVIFNINYWNNWEYTATWVQIMSQMTWFELMSTFPGYNYSNGSTIYRSGITLTSGQSWSLNITAIITQDYGFSTNFMEISYPKYDHDLLNNTTLTWIDLGIMADIHVNHSYGKAMSWDFWFFVKSGGQRVQLYNNVKNNLQWRIAIDTNGNWKAKINLISNGDQYLAVFKWDWNLSVWYTWIYNTNITWFDFQDFTSHPNLYPSLVYNNSNYFYMWDIEVADIPTYDLVNDIDFNTVSENLTLWTNLLYDIYDFDVNITINAIEQSIIIWNLQKKWFIYLVDQSGADYYNYFWLSFSDFL